MLSTRLYTRLGTEKVEILQSGITAINVSTAGFDAEMYLRVYRNGSYQRMRRNVLALVETNTALGSPVAITIALRPDRPLEAVLRDADFQPILAHKPQLDYTWSFTSVGGRITREILPASMKLRVVNSRRESCVNTYNGPIVLPDGSVMGCSCVAAMDGVNDLGIGNVLQGANHRGAIEPRRLIVRCLGPAPLMQQAGAVKDGLRDIAGKHPESIGRRQQPCKRGRGISAIATDGEIRKHVGGCNADLRACRVQLLFRQQGLAFSLLCSCWSAWWCKQAHSGGPVGR